MKVFIGAVTSLLLASEPVDCFTIRLPSSTRPFFGTHLHQAANEDGKGKTKKKRKQQKKRRFAQEVDPVIEFVPPEAKPIFAPPKQQKTTKNVSYSRTRSKNMVQSGKSIEELEGIMAKRYGTDDEWKVDFNEWEVVDDDGNKAAETKHARKSVSSGRKVRSKPVLDPWEKEERTREFNAKKKKKDKEAYDNTNLSAFQSAKNRQDLVLERVQRNQERLQSKKKGNEEDLKNDINTEIKIDQEFYDEDDEGYEPSMKLYNGEDEDLEDEAEDFYNNIISPEPVGGAGSSRSRDLGSSQGSFFFSDDAPLDDDPTPVIEVEISEEEQEFREKRAAKQKKEKKKKASRVRMVDANGADMFLTLEQAKLNAGLASHDNDEETTEPKSSWEEVGITNQILLQNLQDMGCAAPLPVQDKACPSVVSGNDVLVSTHTGSGKTLAFVAPLAETLLFNTENKNSGVKVIIVAPGRELASQIVAVARDLLKNTGLTATLAIGGTPFGRNFEQIRKKKPDFIIGTPGRIAELVVGQPGDKSGKLKIANLQAVVLDECDALLEYEPHRDPTTATMEVLKRRHGDSLQSILCSATAGDLLGKSLLDDFLRKGYSHAQSDDSDELITPGDAKTIRVSRTAIHGVVRVDHQRFALDVLRKVLYTEPAPQQVLIFVDNARRVGIVVDKLAQLGIIAAPLHGGQGSEKGDRAEVNKALREGFVGIVVATEMAARGIDAPFLTHVINLDLPTDASHYAHRAGRCGRGGRPGVVVNIAVGAREKNVPMKFAKALDIDMYLTEPEAGKLAILENTNSDEKKI